MPTHNPRVNVTMTPEQYELLSRLSRLQGRSRAALLLELLETVTPVLERVCVVGEAAQRAQVQAKEGLRESVERAEAQILPYVEKALGQFDLFLSDVTRQIDGEEGRELAPASVATGRELPPTEGDTQGGGPRSVTRGPSRGANAGTRGTKNPRKKCSRRRASP